MNALTLALASFLTVGGVAPPGPLRVVKWEAALVEGKSNVRAAVSAEGGLIPLPDELVKDGWLCVITQRDKPKPGFVSQSIMCQFGHEVKSPSISVTAICSTEDNDVDSQRLLIGTVDRAIGISLTCSSRAVVGAENI